MKKTKNIIVYSIIISTVLLLTACDEIIVKPVKVSYNQDAIAALLAKSSQIDELYYEEAYETAYYSGGVMITNISKVWFKDNMLKTEDEIMFFKDDQLLYTETVGELYNYTSWDNVKYYIGPYPEQAQLLALNYQDSMGLPRDQTILWYLDWVTLDINTVKEVIYEGQQCLIVEILKNRSGSTDVWLSLESGLPVKVVNNYNGNTTEREYLNINVGSGAVPDIALTVPPGAIIL